jgi:hypothetical protein
VPGEDENGTARHDTDDTQYGKASELKPQILEASAYEPEAHEHWHHVSHSSGIFPLDSPTSTHREETST